MEELHDNQEQASSWSMSSHPVEQGELHLDPSYRHGSAKDQLLPQPAQPPQSPSAYPYY
jgi:hypothetical protein